MRHRRRDPRLVQFLCALSVGRGFGPAAELQFGAMRPKNFSFNRSPSLISARMAAAAAGYRRRVIRMQQFCGPSVGSSF